MSTKKLWNQPVVQISRKLDFFICSLKLISYFKERLGSGFFLSLKLYIYLIIMDRKETISEELSDVKKEIETYFQSKLDLTKLQAAEDLSRFASGIAVKLVLFYIAMFVLIFVSMAAAFAIGTYTNSNELGFLVVAGVYVLFAFIFYLFKGILIQTPVIKAFIQIFFQNFSKYDKE